jgi:hypothetical protein
MYPGNWLRDRRWEDPPPPGTVVDQQGNVVAVEQQSAHDSWQNVTARLIADAEARNERLRAKGLGDFAW